MPFERISVVGLGYIGLPTAAVFAGRKVEVIGVDVNAAAIEMINQGKIHIVEPDLDLVVNAAVSQGYLRATSTPEPADAFLLAVPTPFKLGQGGDGPQPDLSYIEAASRAIAPVLKPNDLVVLESTSPVGATEQMAGWLAGLRPDLTFPQTHGEKSDIRVAHCPERVLPGHVLRELVHNDRVIGGMTPECSARALELYKIVVEGECIVTDCRTAEMVKLTENSFRDVNIAFANELSIICDKLAIDVWELIRLANRHPRVKILQPGPGVGGHCIAVDPWFIVARTPDEARLIRTAREVNDGKPKWVLERVDVAIGQFLRENRSRSVKDLTIACYGLAFKPDIDDLRESPALRIVEELSNAFSGQLLAVEPHVESLPPRLAGVKLTDIGDALATADIHLVLVGHSAFRSSAALRDAHSLDFAGVFADQVEKNQAGEAGATSGRNNA